MARIGFYVEKSLVREDIKGGLKFIKALLDEKPPLKKLQEKFSIQRKKSV